MAKPSRQPPQLRQGPELNTRRTRKAHHSKASREKITDPRHRAWDDNELLRLRTTFQRKSKAEVLAAFPGRTWAAICAQAHKRGYRRQQPALKPTGLTVIDQILQRARSRNLSLDDLDRIGRVRGYFKHRRWRSALRASPINIVVRFLGGQLRARWS